MKLVKSISIGFFLILIVLATPRVSAAATHQVDDNGVECPNATYTTIASAAAVAQSGDIIELCTGEYTGIELSKSLVIRGRDNHVALVNDGPLHPAGLVYGFLVLPWAEGSFLNKMSFEVDLPVFSRDGVNNVSASYNKIKDPIQGITNWHGDNWNIRNNEITDLRTRCGGGIGILVGAFNGSTSEGNLVAHNTLTGTVHVDPTDCGGYSATGIVLFSDYRFGRTGGMVTNNTVRVNKVKIVSDNPSLVDVIGFEMTDSRDDLTVRDIVNNVVKANDFRGMVNTIELTPENLDEFNTLAENKE